MILDFRSPCKQYTLSFEDDEKVAYAYLKRDGDIVGDVWLYNCCPTPMTPEWSDRSKIPFANSKEFVSDEARMQQDVTSSDLNVDWEFDDEKLYAYIYVRMNLYGVVGVGDKPGYARFAVKSSRLARVMELED